MRGRAPLSKVPLCARCPSAQGGGAKPIDAAHRLCQPVRMSHDPMILILAAGASSRMRGADKLLQPIDGIPQIARIAKAAIATGKAVIIALPADHPGRKRAVADLQATALTVEDASEGMAASIRAGVALAKGACGLMILPADMPDLEADDLRAVLRAFMAAPSAILRATSASGEPGHPVMFPADLFADLARIKGDEGARAILKQHRSRLRTIPLSGQRATTDLDTPEDWAIWRAARTQPPA